MKRYINANALIQDIEQSRADNNHNNAIASQTHNAEHRHFIKMVLDQPTADVVEVVRCKDCKHWGGVTYGFICRKFSGIETKICMGTEHFCSYGERKE